MTVLLKLHLKANNSSNMQPENDVM